MVMVILEEVIDVFIFYDYGSAMSEKKELGHCEWRQSRRKRNEEALASLPRAAERERLRKIRPPDVDVS